MPTYDDDHARRAVAKLIAIGAGSLTTATGGIL
jgi:hypothetical protein